jgi:hypothetical protein
VVAKSNNKFPEVGVIDWAIEKSAVEVDFPSFTQELIKVADARALVLEKNKNMKIKNTPSFLSTVNLIYRRYKLIDIVGF